MADDGWRLAVVGTLVAAVVITVANHDDPSQTASADPVAVPTHSPAGAKAPAMQVAKAHTIAAPVLELDDLGTRGLTGRDGDTVALTFDDGPHPTYTPQVLAILRDHGVTATFCVVGQQVETYPDLLRQVVADGHALCDHTITHDMSLPTRSDGVISEEIGGTLDAIHAAAPDADVPFFRAPGGYFAANVNAVAESLGQTPLGWSIDTRDWSKPGATAIHDQIVSDIHPGAIVLLHDGGGNRAGTVKALPGIIESLHDLGYEFVVPAHE
jgi:peptidoglycan/xylan/chitin deacetylase (PgdA/CDA1 family)